MNGILQYSEERYSGKHIWPAASAVSQALLVTGREAHSELSKTSEMDFFGMGSEYASDGNIRIFYV